MDLKNITRLVQPMMERYREVYKEMAHSELPIVGKVNDHLSGKEGKQLRPLLTMLCACCCTPMQAAVERSPLYEVTASLEMLHNSTLMHDDVVDESDTRRGQPTVNRLWGNKVAVLMGDYYLSKVMLTLNHVNDPQTTEIMSHVALTMSEGELIQQQCCGRYDTEPSLYIEIIRRKTAVFLSACCQLGALHAGADRAAVDNLRLFGEALGIAFQIRDDLIDYQPTEKTGKPQGNDLREHKATLPLILALRQVDAHTKRKIVPLLETERHDDATLEELIDFVRRSGQLETAGQTMHNYLDQADSHLSTLPDNKYRDGLLQIVAMLKEI